MDKRLVVSFPRSGTHFLMATLAQIYGHKDPEVQHFDFPLPEEFDGFIDHWKDKETDVIFKSHHQRFRFDDRVFRYWKVYYIIRDPIDTLISYWLLDKRIRASGISFEEFCLEMPPSHLRYGEETFTDAINMVEAWVTHTFHWTHERRSGQIEYDTLKKISKIPPVGWHPFQPRPHIDTRSIKRIRQIISDTDPR